MSRLIEIRVIRSEGGMGGNRGTATGWSSPRSAVRNLFMSPRHRPRNPPSGGSRIIDSWGNINYLYKSKLRSCINDYSSQMKVLRVAKVCFNFIFFKSFVSSHGLLFSMILCINPALPSVLGFPPCRVRSPRLP